MRKEAQVSMEFLFLVVIGFMIFIVFSIVAREQTIDAAEKKEYIMLKDIAFMVQTEINSAYNVEDGYERIFVVPETINDEEYTIYILGNYLVANTSARDFVVTIPDVNGIVNKGNNTLRKQSGELYLS